VLMDAEHQQRTPSKNLQKGRLHRAMHDATFGVVDKVVPYGGVMSHKWTDEELWWVPKPLVVVTTAPQWARGSPLPTTSLSFRLVTNVTLAAYSCLQDPALSAYVPGRRIMLEICRRRADWALDRHARSATADMGF
jgi:hypothetical protein